MSKKPPVKLSGLIKTLPVIPPEGDIERINQLPKLPTASVQSVSDTPPPSLDESEVSHSVATSSVIPVAGLDMRMIAVGLIDPNPYPPRTVYSKQVLKDRAASLREDGQLEAIHVIPHPDDENRFMIADGWTRVLSCLEYDGLPALRAQVHHDLTPVEASLMGYNANEQREAMCDLDKAMYFANLNSQGKMSWSAIAKLYESSKQTISNFKAFLELPPELIEVVQAEPKKFSSNAAVQMLRMYKKCGLRKTLSLAHKFAAEDQTLRWFISQAQAQMESEAPKSKAGAKVFRFSNGVFKERGQNVETSITIADPLRRTQFAHRLEELVREYAESDDITTGQKSLLTKGDDGE